jgi:hypothetical protein
MNGGGMSKGGFITVRQLYDRLTELDEAARPKMEVWNAVLTRVVIVLFFLAAVLAIIAVFLHAAISAPLVRVVLFILTAILLLVVIGGGSLLIRGAPRMWTASQRAADDIDAKLKYEREVIEELRQQPSMHLKELRARLDSELKIVTRRVTIFAVLAGMTSLSVAVFPKTPPMGLPVWFDYTEYPMYLAALVVAAAVVVMMMISMASKLERLTFILVQAASEDS